MGRDSDDGRPGGAGLGPFGNVLGELLAEQRDPLLVLDFDSVGEAILVVAVEPGPRFRYTAVNRRAAELVGLPEERLVGREVQVGLPPEDAERVLHNYREIVRTGEGRSVVLEVHVPEHRAWEVEAQPLLDDTGTVTNVIAVIRDITAERRAVRRAVEHFEASFVGSPVGLALMWPDGRIQRVNRALTDLLGVGEQDLAGRWLHELTHAGDRDRVRRHLGELVAGTRPSFQLEVRLVGPGDDPVWVLLAVTGVLDDGIALSAVAQIVDVTALRRVEGALRERLALEQVILEAAAELAGATGARIDSAVERVLRRLAEYAGVDRAEVLVVGEHGRVGQVYEWCRPGVPSIRAQVEAMPAAVVDTPIAHRLRAGEVVHVPSVEELPTGSLERHIADLHGVAGFLMVPVPAGERVIGALTFIAVRSERRWAPDSLALLPMLAQVMGPALLRRLGRRPPPSRTEP
ncbi:MAG: PAS domain-containing protein [Acidimicrobiales bacterium]|nr:PAS domain-containing protein [Acidimicrobiales bacterium]